MDNVARVRIDGLSAFALLDTGCQINLVTPEFVTERGLEMGSMNTLVDQEVKVVGVAGLTSQPLGYVTLQVQVDGVSGYNEPQIALVVPDNSEFARRVPVTLGTPVIGRVVNVIKESELDAISTPWAMARTAHLLANARRAHTEIRDDVANRPLDPLDFDEVVRAKRDEVVYPFSSAMVHAKTETVFMGYRLNVMSQSLKPEDGSLPPGLTVNGHYDTLKNGSQSITISVRNHTPFAIKICKNEPVARVVTGNAIPTTELIPGTLEALDEMQGVKRRKLPPTERQKLLMEKLDLSGLEAWSPENAEAARRLLQEYHDIFALEEAELGCTSTAEHHIKVTDDEPFKERFRRIPPNLVEEVRTHLKEMLDAGAIRPSQSPWCNAVVLVRKKDGGLRFCIDFRKLNARTKKDSYPLPRINEALESLAGAAHFSSLDLKSGFWQIRMAEDSKQYTAFTVGNMGFYECERMPFGLCNAPATFQRLMQNCLGELNLTYCLIYLDDVIVYSKTEEGHVHRLRTVFERFRENNLKLKPSKCNLFRQEITYLAHHVSKEGVRPSRENLTAVADFPPPDNYTQIRAFLGLAGHYRRFIKGFSRIAEPLHEYLSGEGASKKTEKLELSPEALRSFETLKKACLTAPVLVFADYSKPFLLETDASKHGLGAVLSQKQDDGKYHPVAYGSKSLSVSERKYHSSKLEFLALKWAILDHFKEYLMFGKFTVRTDNNPLTYIQTTPNLDATGLRWVAALAQYDFGLEYQRGKDNTVADVLSRKTATLDRDTVRALLDGIQVGPENRADIDAPEMTQKLHEVESEVRARAARLRAEINVTDWVQTQREDEVLARTIDWLHGRKKENLREMMGDLADTDEGKAILKRRAKMALRNGCLYLEVTPKGEVQKLSLFVVPKSQRVNAINGCHRDAGHQGQTRTKALVTERFWWPGVREQVEKAVRFCERCRTYEAKAVKAPLLPLEPTEVQELVHVDFTTMETTMDLGEQPKTVNVLVFTDHFSRFVAAYITPDQTAQTVAKFLYRGWISVYGTPTRIMSDQGRAFTSNVVRELCDFLNVERVRTSPYHPQSNGQVERMHQTLARMIGKLDEDKKRNWPAHLQEAVHAYNCTRSEVTGMSPWYVMFGRRPGLPVDFVFPTIKGIQRSRTVDDYVAVLKDRLTEALRIARKESSQEAIRQKRLYDRRIGATLLKPADRVLVKCDAYRGKRKLKARWHDKVWEVKHQVADGVPTYVLKDENGREKVFHRNRLLLLTPVLDQSVALRAEARLARDVVCSSFYPTGPTLEEGDTEEKSQEVVDPNRGPLGPIPLGWIDGRLRPVPWTRAGVSTNDKG